MYTEDRGCIESDGAAGSEGQHGNGKKGDEKREKETESGTPTMMIINGMHAKKEKGKQNKERKD